MINHTGEMTIMNINSRRREQNLTKMMRIDHADNRVGDTSDLLDLPQEMGLARRGSF